jgi:hypothetical protein
VLIYPVRHSTLGDSGCNIQFLGSGSRQAPLFHQPSASF